MEPSKETQGRRGGKIGKPVALKQGHDLGAFDCGRDEITRWLKDRALKAGENGTAVTYVVCRGARRVVGYFALAAGAVERDAAPGALKRNCLDPIPVIILARLGVDKLETGHGLGKDLLSEAMRRSIHAAKIIGARALLVHALDGRAADFYLRRGFEPLNANKETLFLSVRTIRDGL